jgi:hypothetical protein
VARKATVGRQPSRCVFGTDPWRDFMAAEVHGLRVDHNGLFTTVEHAVLANWFDQRRPLSLRTSSGTTHSLSLALIPRRRGRARCQAPSGRGPWRCSSDEAGAALMASFPASVRGVWAFAPPSCLLTRSRLLPPQQLVRNVERHLECGVDVFASKICNVKDIGEHN